MNYGNFSLAFFYSTRRFLITVLLACITTAFSASAQLNDPWASLHPSDNIQILFQLRPPLAKNPNDQDALGCAIMAYINLGLTGHPEYDGLDGSWLDYAKQLCQRRVAARQGKPWTSLSAAAPELWTELIMGNRLTVATHLKQWQTMIDDPQYRALFVLSTGDWRTFEQKPPLTIHEKYAALRTGYEMDHRNLSNALKDDKREYNPAIYSLICRLLNLDYDRNALLGEPVAMTAWLLASQDIPDAEAVTHLNKLSKAFNLNALPQSERKALWKSINAQAITFSDDELLRFNGDMAITTAVERSARLLAVCYAICDKLSDRQPGFIANDGSLSLYGIGDIARWNRSHLLRSASYTFNGLNDLSYAQRDKCLYGIVRTEANNSFLAAHMSLGRQISPYTKYNDIVDNGHWTAYFKALNNELQRTHGLSAEELATNVRRMAKMKPAQMLPYLKTMLTKLPKPILRPGFGDLFSGADECGMETELLADLRHWQKEAPNDPALFEHWAPWQPDYRLYDSTQRKPASTWTDTSINYGKLPTPAMRLRQGFSIIWTGKIKIEQPGDYVFAFETDDAAHLVIGDIAISKPALRGQSTIRISNKLQAGSYDLTFEYEHARGNALCRLLWATPMETELSPIPASVLFSDDGKKPGLQARGYNFWRATSARRIFSQRELDFSQTVPWNLKLWDSIADSFYIYDDYAKAAPYYLQITQSNQSLTRGVKYTLCQLKKTPPDAESVITFAESRPDLWDKFEVVDFCDVVLALQNVNRLSDYLAIYRQQHQRIHQMWPYGESLLALSEGRLKDAYVFMNDFLAPDKNGGRYLSESHFRLLFQHQLVLKRIYEENLDWKALRHQYQRGTPTPWADLVVDWLSGEVPWESCIARVPEIKDGEQLLYVRAWVDVTTGDHAAAKKGFADMLAKHPTWFEAPFCARMIEWYAKQTLESLEKLPRAKPVVPKAGVKLPAKSGANDF